MNETVTVDEAIAKGKRMVNFPTIVIMCVTIGLGFYLGIQDILPIWIIFVGFALGLTLPWLYWSIVITKWRLWAFDNVRNVHELKKRAIQEKLIWPDNSFFEKTEIRNTNDKERWNSLQDKFKKDDHFVDDITVPFETIIYYSKSKNLIEMIIMIFCLGFGVYMLIKTDSYIIGIGFTLFGAYSAFKEFREATNAEPQIILNDKGIQTSTTQFYEWKDIENEEAIQEGSGKSMTYYLQYEHPDGIEMMFIEGFETDINSLNKLLVLYRGRNKKKNIQR